MAEGYVHVYTGNGKGKTTAAFGLSVRAALAGKRVYIGQFVKDMKYSEASVGECIPNITIEQLGLGCFVNKPSGEDDVIAAREALEKCTILMASGDYDVVVLDEVSIAVYLKYFDVDALINAIEKKQKHVEVICTGRYAESKLIAFADLVTEMVEVKHYYKKGVLSRPGIDC